MQVSHLQHGDCGIHCRQCGQRFEIRSRTLRDPLQLLERKEGIAARHTCNQRPQRTIRPRTRVWRMPAGREQLSQYFDRELSRIWGSK